jgi:hypothetical protein
MNVNYKACHYVIFTISCYFFLPPNFLLRIIFSGTSNLFSPESEYTSSHPCSTESNYISVYIKFSAHSRLCRAPTNHLQPSCTTCFNILNCVLYPQRVMHVFRMDLTINNDSFRKKHEPLDRCSGGILCFL